MFNDPAVPRRIADFAGSAIVCEFVQRFLASPPTIKRCRALRLRLLRQPSQALFIHRCRTDSIDVTWLIAVFDINSDTARHAGGAGNPAIAVRQAEIKLTASMGWRQRQQRRIALALGDEDGCVVNTEDVLHSVPQ